MRLSHYPLYFALVAVIISCNDKESQNPTTTSSVTIDGQQYATVKLGSQTWTTTNYAGSGGLRFDGANSKPEYGKYYTFEELQDITLPAGWRIPTMNDYSKLAIAHSISIPTTIGSTQVVRGLISTTNWNNVSGTNSTGFNAHPTGYMFGSVQAIDGDIAEFWTAEGYSLSIQEAGEQLTSLRMSFYDNSNSDEYRYTIRFVKD